MGLFTRLCEAPATSLHPTNEPGPQLGRHIPCFRQAAISQAAKTYVVLEHSCGWSFPAITPFGWEALAEEGERVDGVRQTGVADSCAVASHVGGDAHFL